MINIKIVAQFGGKVNGMKALHLRALPQYWLIHEQ